MGDITSSTGIGTYILAKIKKYRTDPSVLEQLHGYVISGVGRREWDILITEPDSPWAGCFVTLSSTEFDEVTDARIQGIPSSAKMEKGLLEKLRSMKGGAEEFRITKSQIIERAEKRLLEKQKKELISCIP